MGAALTCLQGVCCGASCLSRILGGVVGVSKSLRGTGSTEAADGGGTSPKTANLIELGFFMFNSFLAWFMTREFLQQNVNGWVQLKFTCDHGQCFGIPAAGKILSALMSYQLFMLIGYVFISFAFKKDVSEKFRQFHGNYWTVKFVIWAFMLVILFMTVHWKFFEKTMSFWVMMAVVFVIYQVLTSVEFAFSQGLWFTKCLPREGETNGTMVFGLSLIGGFFALHIGFFIYYSRLDIYCSKEIGFLLLNFLVSLLAIMISISTWAQDKRPSMGLISSSICVIYASYLLISGYASVPGSTCNPFPLSHTSNLMITLASGSLVFLSTGYVALRVFKSERDILSDKNSDSDEELSIIQSENKTIDYNDSDSGEIEEDSGVSRKYILYRLVLMGGTAYIFMMITDWGSITEQGVFTSFGYGILSSWVKILSSWLTHLVFFLGVVLPYLCHDHEFF